MTQLVEEVYSQETMLTSMTFTFKVGFILACVQVYGVDADKMQTAPALICI